MAFDVTVDDDDSADVAPVETTEVETEQDETPETDETEVDEVQGENDESESEGEDSTDEPEADAKPKKGAAARIQQLIAEKKAYEAELEQLRQQSQQPKQAQTQQSADGGPVPPQMDDYDIETSEGLDAYFAAQSEYEKEQKAFEFDQHLQRREQAQKQEQKAAEITNTFKQRFEKNPKFKEDFQQLTTLMQDAPINADPSQLYEGDDLMDILEEVAGNPDLYYEIAAMPEPRQYAEFGRIHAQIQARKGAPKANRQSKAPPPPNHTKSNAPISRNDYEKSDDDFLSARGLS